MRISLPLSVWYDTLDPNASAMAAEIGLPEPRFQRRGRGGTMHFDDITIDQAREVQEYIHDRALTLMGDTPVEDRAVLRAAIQTSRLIGQQVHLEKVKERND